MQKRVGLDLLMVLLSGVATVAVVAGAIGAGYGTYDALSGHGHGARLLVAILLGVLGGFVAAAPMLVLIAGLNLLREIADFWDAADEELRAADGILVASEVLAREYNRLNRNVTVCRTGIDASMWPECRRGREDVFRIGIACSRSHLRDLAVVAPALRWAARQPGVEVVTLGADPTTLIVDPGEFPSGLLADLVNGRLRDFREVFAAANTVARRRIAAWSFPRRHVPWVESFAAYRRNMQVLDVALCPVRRGWSTLRADSKPLEHLAAGSLPLVSDVATYDWWRPLLPPPCRTQADWLERVRWAVENQDTVRDIASSLRSRVMDERSISREIVVSWEAALAA